MHRAWIIWVIAGLILLGFTLNEMVGRKVSDEPVDRSGQTVPGEQPEKPIIEEQEEICGKSLTSALLLDIGEGSQWDEPIEYEEYDVRYRQVASTSLRLDRKTALISRRSDQKIVGVAEVMNVDIGCYWEWADSQRVLSTDAGEECTLESMFENEEIQQIFPEFKHFTFLGLASRPGTDYIDYLKLTSVRADNLLSAASRVIPEPLRAHSVPLVMGLGRNENRRKRDSTTEKKERSAYLIGIRECLAELNAVTITEFVLGTAEISGVKFSDYSHARGALKHLESGEYNAHAPFKDWKLEDQSPQDD